MYLYFLNADNDYQNHTFFNLTDEIQSQEKWMKTWIMMNNEYTFLDMIDTKYVKTQKLNIQKLKQFMSAKEFNEKVSWIFFVNYSQWLQSTQENICCFSNQHCDLIKSIKNISSVIL